MGPDFSALVIDDDEISLELMSLVLTQAGAGAIHTAGDGRKGLRLLAGLQPKPDLLLCDLYMPDMDAIETIQALAATGYSGRLILVTGGDLQMLSLASEIARANGLRLLGSVIKPVNADAIFALLRNEDAAKAAHPL
jgi:CheY-like chemotaxis protein